MSDLRLGSQRWRPEGLTRAWFYKNSAELNNFTLH